MSDRLVELEQALRVLEEENALLAERAEDSMLLGVIAEHLHGKHDGQAVLEHVLERISILKGIPFCSCVEVTEGGLRPVATYASFSDQLTVGCPMTLSDGLLERLKKEAFEVPVGGGFRAAFDAAQFVPTCAALFPFQTQTIEQGLFLFMDQSAEPERFSASMMLLAHVIEMAVARFDNLHLLQALTEANDRLEKRVEERTVELMISKQALEREFEQKVQSEAALKISQETLLTVLNSIDAKVYVADMQSYEVLFCNRNWLEVCGEDATGKKCYEALRGRSSPCEDCINASLLSPEGEPGEVMAWEDDDMETGRWSINHDRAIRWPDGRLVRLQISTDISPYKRMEQQLHQSQKLEAIGRLAGGVAHDFNNLLMGVQGRATLLGLEVPEHASWMEHVKAIEEYVERASRLTHQLLGFARGGKYEVASLELNPLILDSVTLFGRTHKELHISLSLEEVSPIISADRGQVEQVLLNMYINAWHAMPEGGQLQISCSSVIPEPSFCEKHGLKEGDYACISIADSGVGMDAETVQHIFEPFFTTREPGAGSGMGLASAYGIVLHHAGSIQVKSSLGAGTVFEIYLPLSEKPAACSPISTSKTIYSGTGKIVLVDDESFILDVGAAMLSRLGFEVLTASSGSEAIKLVKEAPVDLMILDMIMPGMDGCEVFDVVHAFRPALPVILSSGYAQDGHADALFKRGCAGFIQKPYSLAKLSEKVQEVLGTSIIS